jgi:hypothetical protein
VGTTGTSGTSGTSGTGTLCATCTQDTDCGAGGACALETAGASTGYCALACTSAGGCTDSRATCVDLFGDGSQFCYPTAGSCQSSGTTTAGTTGATGTTGTTGASGTTGSSCTSDTWANYGQQFFSTYCVSCHSWASSQTSVQSEASASESRIASGNMPPSTTLSSAEISRVDAWLNCGAP